MENSLKEQEKLGIKLDKAQLIAGVQDAFADKSKLSDQRSNRLCRPLKRA
nr:FKBP-type peptidyl-prolyl cis-trans isomerase fkpA precursor [Klebsiella pneumoniae]